MARYRLRFHPLFTVDLESAIVYYDELSKPAARKFKTGIKKQLNLIKQNPYTYAIRYDDVRFARVEKFPYAIHYSVDAINNQVLIQAILSDHQDPETNWKKRF